MDTEKIGKDIAFQCGWDGMAILRIAEAALTEANFHSEAIVIRGLISKL